MSLLLNIDSSTDTASIALSENGRLLSLATNREQKDHASWLHLAIENMCKECGKQLSQLNAIVVTEGPGSYTGLRVGMATAKGLCFTLGIKLITVGTLKLMATAAAQLFEMSKQEKPMFFCPMIDARRMEVFTAVYGADLSEIHAPTALILDEHAYQNTLQTGRTVFFGNGADKWKQLCVHSNAVFMSINFNAAHLISLGEEKFHGAEFADLAYVEPLYVKEFYTSAKNSSGSTFNGL